MPDQPADQRFAAEKQQVAEILRTTEKNLAARMVGLGIGPTCGRCGGSGNYSYNQTHGTRCFGCAGNRVLPPKTCDQWQVAIQQARTCVAEGKLDTYVAYLGARSAAKKAGDMVMNAWTATGISKLYDWRKACQRTPDGNAAHPRDRLLADINKLIADEYTQVSELATALQVGKLEREERQARTIALAEAANRSVDRIRSIAALHLGPDGGDPRAAALARLLGAHNSATSVAAYGELMRRVPADSEIGQARANLKAALAAATEAVITGDGLDQALAAVLDLTASSPASLLQQATRRTWRLYFPYEPQESDVANHCRDLEEAVALGHAAQTRQAPTEPMMEHLRSLFSTGQDSVSKNDVLEDGRTISDHVGAVLAAAANGTSVNADALLAARCMDQVWGGGFEMARAQDATDDGRTLSELAFPGHSPCP